MILQGTQPVRRAAGPVTYGNSKHMKNTIPVLGFAAFSGTGKTTLLEQLIPRLNEAGLRIGMIKHAHHNFDVDQPGKDSYRLRKAGARQMLIASSKRQALMTEHPSGQEPRLDELLNRLDMDAIDMVLVEGFKHVPYTKIELRREELGKPLLYPDDPDIIAVASDRPHSGGPLPALDINDTEGIVTFILGWLKTQGVNKG